MTDNEIIKALECCTYNITQEKCDECPLYGRHCTTELARNALDLINRQKAEIEKLKDDLEYLNGQYLIQDMHMQDIKAEAVKEVINKAKEEAQNVARVEFNGYTYFCVGTSFFDNLLKETVGDADG